MASKMKSLLPVHSGEKSGHRPRSPMGLAALEFVQGDGEPNYFQRLLVEKMEERTRGHFVAALGEFVGTVLFLLLAFGIAQVANASVSISGPNASVAAAGPNLAVLLYVSLGFGFSLAVNAWIFYRVSGGLFNPAVTLGMLLIGSIGPFRAALLFVAQLLGGICASAIVLGLLPGSLNVNTKLSGGTNIAQGLFIEMFLTAELVFTIFMLAAEKHKATYLAPIGIGLSLFIAELFGVYYTGGSLNPARSFGPAVVSHSFAGYHWIYWLGPVLGSLLAVGFYNLLKILEYDVVANPNRDVVDVGQKPPTTGGSGSEKRTSGVDGRTTSSSRQGGTYLDYSQTHPTQLPDGNPAGNEGEIHDSIHDPNRPGNYLMEENPTELPKYPPGQSPSRARSARQGDQIDRVGSA